MRSTRFHIPAILNILFPSHLSLPVLNKGGRALVNGSPLTISIAQRLSLITNPIVTRKPCWIFFFKRLG